MPTCGALNRYFSSMSWNRLAANSKAAMLATCNWSQSNYMSKICASTDSSIMWPSLNDNLVCAMKA